MNKSLGYLVLFTIFVIVPFYGAALEDQKGPDNLDACVTARQFVRNQLKSPATAVFPACATPDTIVIHHDDHWTVHSYVDAQNSFGAMIRADTTVHMVYSLASRRWTATNIEVINRE